MDCLFCQIANKTIKSDIVFEDDDVVAFNDIDPKAPQHVLIIPRQHIATLNDLNNSHQALIGHMMLTATRLAQQLHIAQPGYRLVMNCNKAGGQAVYHIHLHLLGGRTLTWPPG